MTAPVQDDDALWKRVSLELARFKPFDGEAYDGFAQRLIAMVRDADASHLSPTPETGPIEQVVVWRKVRAVATWDGQRLELLVGDVVDGDAKPPHDLAQQMMSNDPMLGSEY